MITELLRNNVIVGGLEDQVEALVSVVYRSLIGSPFKNSIPSFTKSNQPIFEWFFNGVGILFNRIAFTNIFSIVSLLLSFLGIYFLLTFLKVKKFIAFLLSLVFAFSPYNFINIGIHPSLAQIWVVPVFALFLLDFLNNGRFRKAFFAGIFLSLSLLTSNYLGYFLILFTFCFLISNIIIKTIFKEINFVWIKQMIFGYFIMGVTFLAITILALFPYIKANYIGKAIGYKQEAVSKKESNFVVQRTLEEFQNFSGRPWYLFLPPIQNPIFGGITKNVLDWMKNDWGYFLADDYFNKESPAMFLGWANIVVFMRAVFLSLKAIRKKNNQLPIINNQRIINFQILVWALTALLLFLFTLPPFFTLGGITVYTPGWILFKLFPMFRVTQRLGVLIFLCVLIVNGLYLSSIFKRNIKFIVVIIFITFITMVEFYIPVTYADVSKVPAVYEYLASIKETQKFEFEYKGKKGNYEGPVIIAEYPGGRAEEIFWITRHQKGLINPRGYINSEYGFSSYDFTKYLATKEGLDVAKSLGVRYIVFDLNGLLKSKQELIDSYKNEDPEKFFNENCERVGGFEGKILYKIRNTDESNF